MVKRRSLKSNFVQTPIVDFLKELSSDSASPGGGAAAALTGAIGVSLIEMVSRINERRSQKKPDHKSTPASFKTKLTSLAKIRSRLGILMRLDTEAFLKLSRFSKEKKMGSLYDKALRAAVSVPLEMARLIQQAIALGETEIIRTSRWLASDLAEAGILLEASFHSARLNVEINLKSIQDASQAAAIRIELDELQEKVAAFKKNLSEVLSR